MRSFRQDIAVLINILLAKKEWQDSERNINCA